MFEEFLITLLRIGQLMVVSALPLWIRYTITGVMHHHDKIGYFAVPGLARLSFFSGMIFGGALLYANHNPDFYYFDTVFAADGPWAVPFDQFFTVWLNPLRYSPLVLWERIEALDLTDTLTAFVAVSAALAGWTLMAAIYYFRMKFLWALLKSLAVWGWAAALSIYIACAVAWSLNLMNFWAVVVAFLVVRHRSLAAH